MGEICQKAGAHALSAGTPRGMPWTAIAFFLKRLFCFLYIYLPNLKARVAPKTDGHISQTKHNKCKKKPLKP